MDAIQLFSFSEFKQGTGNVDILDRKLSTKEVSVFTQQLKASNCPEWLQSFKQGFLGHLILHQTASSGVIVFPIRGVFQLKF